MSLYKPLLLPTFFTLTSTEAARSRLILFSQIHQIVYYGKGGYDWYTVYQMPIWLRTFTYNQILEAYEAEAKAMKKQSSTRSNKTTLMDADGNVNTEAAAAFKPAGKVHYK